MVCATGGEMPGALDFSVGTVTFSTMRGTLGEEDDEDALDAVDTAGGGVAGRPAAVASASLSSSCDTDLGRGAADAPRTSPAMA